ncbi:MAG: type IX secretion system sortase PorU, partial [Bacteroidetes bacterium]|nr:type IX secretion system sortase PorU [Bacteroidota bacterium]
FNSVPAFSQKGENSVLAQGAWYKIAVTDYGVYEIDIDFLNQIGLDTETVDPRKIQIFGNGGTMLPQENKQPRHRDLIENAIMVEGEGDGVFNQQDRILFYGQGTSTFYYDAPKKSFFYEDNVYSDTTFYFLTVGQENGLRIDLQENLGDQSPVLTTYDYYEAHELDQESILKPGSGREWYGERFDITLIHEVDFTIPGIVDNSKIQLIAVVLGQSLGPAQFNIEMNNVFLGSLQPASIPDAIYGVKGAETIDTLIIDSNEIPNPDNLTVRLTFERNTSKRSLGHLNYLFLTVKRTLEMDDQQIIFRSLESLLNPTSIFQIANVNNNSQVWDITDPLRPKLQELNFEGNSAKFGTETFGLKEFIGFDQFNLLKPRFSSKVGNQNLHGSGSAQLVVVTHPSLFSEAQRLASFRSQNDGISVKVVTVQQIYNEFSSGAQDVTAIRDYMKFLYDKGSGASRLKYLLLFGKGSFDYKDLSPVNLNLVPIYESRNSLHPIFSYSSDDYFGFLDNDEGLWEETSNGDHLLDIGIGRIPAANLSEAKAYVDKLIIYSTDLDAYGDWRNEIYFVADDGDFNTHQRDADKLAVVVDTVFPQFNVNKIYMDAFPQIPNPSGETAPRVNEALNKAVDNGALVINFTGHGGESGWAHENILDISTINNYSNLKNLPLFVTATCEFGRHDDPNRRSGGELLVLNPKGGAIALVTTARPVFSSTNFLLNVAFYNTVFQQPDGLYQTLGEIMQSTKNNSLNGSINRNFSLLGDPSLRLAYPQKEIIITELNGIPVSLENDTLKALEKVKLKGEIRNPDGSLDTNFNGILIAKVFDKPTSTETLGDEGPTMIFDERKTTLFRGQVSVINASFEMEFVVPKNISYLIDHGKISMYAKNGPIDANGSNIELLIGGSNNDIELDRTPPDINIFLNNIDFRPGDRTGPDPLLLINLSDESGINISNQGLGQEITATLDDSLVFQLNDFYIADLDQFQSGWVEFPLQGLTKGSHAIKVKAFDTHNNSSEKLLEFFSGKNAKVTFGNVINYPNPFSENTTFRISHNREGEDLDLIIQIYSLHGQLIKNMIYQVNNSAAIIDGIEWDGRNNLGEPVDDGIYVYRINIQSLVDGSKNQLLKKLVIIK